MAATRIEDFYSTGEEFESTVRSAIRETESDRGLDFLAEVEGKWQQFGMRAYWSEGQNRFLRRLAGFDE
jgi:hypothetical protein